jgi:hypothetical protein
MIARDARISGDQVKCWHCPCTLGQIVNGIEEPHVLAVHDFYRPGDVPATLAEVGIRSVLIIPKRVRERLAQTGLPWTRRQAMDRTGAVRVKPPQIAAMPVLMPCWRPGCGEANRVIDTDIATV